MSLFLFPHGGSGNHGCEAIVRSTAKLFHGEDIRLFSMHPEQDVKVHLDEVCKIHSERKAISRKSFSYLKSYFDYHFLKQHDAFELLSLSPILSNMTRRDALLSIGGDNYCYNTPTSIYLVNAACRKKGIPTFLWGCSIEESLIDEAMMNDLKGYTHIFARESLTHTILTSKGLKNVSLFPDPAFLMDMKTTMIPQGFNTGHTIGVNVSPLILDYEKSEGITMLNYQSLIDHIIQKTDDQIALIPHVTWPNNDDRKPLQTLYERYKHTGRLVMIEDRNAEELKSIISQCRIMIASRTHASIAAYSTRVPTLVVGYSIKAQGIAQDLFGTTDHYVVPVQSLRTPYDLTTHFKWLMQNEEQIKKHYIHTIPSYIEQAIKARDTLLKYL